VKDKIFMDDLLVKYLQWDHGSKVRKSEKKEEKVLAGTSCWDLTFPT